MTDLAHVDGRVAARSDAFVQEWREACRIPSVSGGITETTRMAGWLEERLGGTFDRVQRVDVDGYAPTLIGTLDGTSERRLLIYTHHDVQPAASRPWSSPPFAAEIVGESVVARGCCDDKADITARLQALDLWLEDLGGRPPYTIVWLSEGAEEVGSPGLDELLLAHRDELHADWCLWESFVRGADGRPEVAFGCRGIVLLELTVRTMKGDQHAAFSPVFRSAATELAHVLSSLVDPSGRVLIPGFEDGIVHFTEAERTAGLTVSPPGSNRSRRPESPSAGIRQQATGRAPPLHADGEHLEHGRRECADRDTVVTAVAHADVDIHLVPGREPERTRRARRATAPSTRTGSTTSRSTCGICAGRREVRSKHRSGGQRSPQQESDDGRSRCLPAAAGSRSCPVGARHPRRDHRFAGGHDATCERYSCARRAWWNRRLPRSCSFLISAPRATGGGSRNHGY